jgi:nucleotide-binding universal stress UspA family protein
VKRFRRILVATDFTPASTGALKEELELAKTDGAELLIAHAYRPPDPIQAESVGPGVYEEWDENLRTGIEEGLRPLVDDARRRLVNARSLALPGIPQKAIAEAVQENGVDLVVLGTHGRRGFSLFLLGSVAARVISTAPCPVMTVRSECSDSPRVGPWETLRAFKSLSPLGRLQG